MIAFQARTQSQKSANIAARKTSDEFASDLFVQKRHIHASVGNQRWIANV
jgi:hypothetical protein